MNESDQSVAGTALEQLGFPASQLLREVIDADDDPDNSAITPTMFDASSAAFAFHDDAQIQSNVVLENFSSDDLVFVQNQYASEQNFWSIGTDLHVSFVSEGGAANLIAISDVVPPDAFIYDRASAEQAMGFEFFQSELGDRPPAYNLFGDLDEDEDRNLATPSFWDASEGSFGFQDDARRDSHAVISNFAPDDRLTLSNAGMDGVQFANDAGDLILTFSASNGAASTVTIRDAVTPGSEIRSEIDAEAEVGFDFLRVFHEPLETNLVSLDRDDDYDLTSSQLFVRSDLPRHFLDNVPIGSNAVILDFSLGDLIRFENIFDAVNFSGVGTDLLISAISAGGAASLVRISDVLEASDFVFGEASAEAALGFDFFDPAGPVAVSLDADSDANFDTPQPFDAAAFDILFTDDAAVGTNAIIDGFGVGDALRVDNLSSEGASFSSTGSDLTVSYVDAAGAVNLVRITNVVGASDFVFNEATAEASVGFDFFNPPPGSAPVIDSLTGPSVADRQPVDFTFAVSDADGDQLSVSVIDLLSGSAAIDGNVITFTPNPNATGRGSFTLLVEDATGLSARQTVEFSVNPPPPDVSLDIDADNDQTSAEAFDAGTGAVSFIDDNQVGSNAVIANFSNGDSIRFLNAFDGVNFTSIGTDLLISAISAGGAANLVRLTDVVDAGDFILDEASAEAAVGFDFFAPQGPLSLDFDSDGDTSTVQSFTAAGRRFSFTDSALISSNAEIEGFGTDDHITVLNATPDGVNFSSTGADLIVSFIGSNGFANLIFVRDVVEATDFVFNEATAEAAVGFDFLSLAAPSLPTEASIDVDSDADPDTAERFDATTGEFIFLDVAELASNAEIAGLSPDDKIRVSNIVSDDISFTAEATDVVISFVTDAGVMNQIRLLDAIDVGDMVSNEVSAEAAVGFDFFSVVRVLSLDLDADGDPATPTSFDSSAESIQFEDNARDPSEALIQGFGRDDRIVVDGINPDFVTFTPVFSDLIITFGLPDGPSNKIRLFSILDGSEVIFDEASAEAALGFDFFAAFSTSAPVIDSLTGPSVADRQPVNFAFAVSDPDGDPLTVSAIDLLAGTADITGNILTFTPDLNSGGRGSFTLLVEDGTGLSTTQTVDLTINPAPPPPPPPPPPNTAPDISVPAALSTEEDTAITITPTISDADGDTLTVAATNVSNATVSNNGDGSFTLTPDADFNGDAAFKLTATDPDGASDSETVTVTVTPVNDAPVITLPGALSVQNDDTIEVQIDAVDPDGDPIAFTAASAGGGSVTIAPGGLLTFAPDAGFTGAASFTVTASDDQGGASDALVIIDVVQANRPPDLQASGGQIAEDAAPGSVAGTVSATDPDGDSTTLALTGDTRFVLTAAGQIVVADGAVFDFETETSIDLTVTATDEDGAESSAGIVVGITDVFEDVNGGGAEPPNLDRVVTLAAARGQPLGLGSGSYNVVGTPEGAETILLGVGSQAVFDASFNRGNDTIIFPKAFAAYGLSLSGSVVTVNADDGTSAQIPLGPDGISLGFADGTRTLAFDPATGGLTFEETSTQPPPPPVVDPDQSTRVIFSPDGETEVGLGSFSLFGSVSGEETLSVLPGAVVRLDPSFNEGGDSITLPGARADFTAVRNGSSLILEDAFTATSLILPLGTAGTVLTFTDGSFNVFFDTGTGQVVFDPVAPPASAFGEDSAGPAVGTFLAGSGDGEGLPADQLAFM
jgi:hypothetical protein